LKTNAYITVFFLILLALIFIKVELGFFSNINNSKITDNMNQGNIILFFQNYSDVNSVPSNIFIGKIENATTLDNAYSTIYGNEKSEIFLDNSSKKLVYTTAINSSQNLNNLFSNSAALNNGSSIQPVNNVDKRLRKGSLYICNFTPMVKCTYEISMDINTDDPQNYLEFYSPGSKLVIRKLDNNTILRSYFQNVSGNMESKTITISNVDKLNLKVSFDGENKTNTITAEDGSYIITPFSKVNRQTLPYIDFSNGYIKFISFVSGNGTYIDVNFSSIKQTAARKFITPIGDNKIIAYGLDGPFPKNLTEQGINYLKSKGDRGTIWFDVGVIAKCNQTDLEYLRNLVNNDSWEVGIHFSKELNSLTDAEAYNTIDTEYEYVFEKIGKKPTSWCSLRNSDSIIHAIYAYNKYGMYWRNGDSGVETEEIIGNLDDDTWPWWELASNAGMTHPVFTHQTDKEPAIKYSISPSKLETWVNNCYSNNVSIVPFYDYSLITRNSHDAYFENISSDRNLTKFDAHTNGFKSLIDVNVNAENNIRIYDNTTNNYLDFKVEADKSITFWVENNHTYNVYSY
jgi:hypothetical protein